MYIILGSAFIFLIIFIAICIVTSFHLKIRQKELNEFKEMLMAFAPHITQDELRETYINFIGEIKYYE